MKRRIPFLLEISAILSLFASCVNRDYKLTGDIDWSVGADMSVVAPIGHCRLKLIDVLPDSLNSFKFCVDGDEVYFSKRDTQHLGNDIIGHLKMYPKGLFTYDMEIDVSVYDQHIGTIERDLEFEFEEINTNPNERLDSILYKENQYLKVSMSLPVTAKEGSYFNLRFDHSEVSLDPDIYPDNSVHLNMLGKDTDAEVNLSKAKIRFNGTKSFHCKLDGYLISEEEMFGDLESELNVEFDGLQPRITYGYLGPDRVIYENTKYIPFNYTKDLQSSDCFLPFHNPEIKLTALNSIGIPAKYMLDWVKLRNTTTGEEVFAEFNGKPGTEFILNYPSPAEIKGLSVNELINFNTQSLIETTEFLLSRGNGHTDRLFQIKGDSLEYHYRIIPLDVQGENVSYFFDDSNIDIAMDVKLVGRFDGNQENPGKNFYVDRYDTMKVDFSKYKLGDKVKLSDETVARIKLDHKNHLPVNGRGTLWFCDSLYNMILDTKTVDFEFDAAPINQDGEVIGETQEGNVYYKFNYEEYQELTDRGKSVIIKYRVLNNELKDVWLKSNDWLDITLELWASGFVSYEQKK